ncbi:unnamed protein product, partial [Iphiclides podalirius]
MLENVSVVDTMHSVLWRKVYENEIIEHFRGINFVESCLQILVEFCNEKKYQTFLQPNLPLSVLERRSEFEVRAHKTGDVQLSPAVETVLPPPTAGLVTALADVLNNVSAFKSCPVESWNDQGVYRVLLRCASWRCDDNAESNRVRAATCRALEAAATRKCVRASLAATKDCLVNLLHVLTSDEQVDGDETSARAQTFQLFACLLSERSAIDSVWSELRRTSYERSELREREATPFFHLLTRSLESADDELSDAATHCLTQLTKSALNRKHADKSIDVSLADFFNDLRLENEQALKSNRSGAGDADRGDGCQPEYVCEELCKLLIYRVQDIFDKKKCLASQDEAWASVCSCLSHLLSVSSRGRLYGVHRQLPRLLLAAVQAVRDQLSLLGKPVDVIRNANHDPVLQTLYWLLTIMNCLMLECPHAKDSFADNITCSLNKLWPWCMMTEQLRGAILHLLVTFTNECPKAWACMCACVGGRSLMSELCALVGRSSSLLLLSLRILRQCVSHHHCRAIILKSEVLACMGKAWRGAGGAAGAQCAWARLCSALARHPDGGGALLALPALRPAHARLLPALAYAAHHHRAAFLHAPDLLELLSATLLTGNTADVVLAARAVWALAANNHRAKLVLRSAGVTSAVQSAMQRVQRDKAGASSSLQALQLLTYTNSVLQAM